MAIKETFIFAFEKFRGPGMQRPRSGEPWQQETLNRSSDETWTEVLVKLGQNFCRNLRSRLCIQGQDDGGVGQDDANEPDPSSVCNARPRAAKAGPRRDPRTTNETKKTVSGLEPTTFHKKITHVAN